MPRTYLTPRERGAPPVEEGRLRRRLATGRAEVALRIAERHAEVEADVVGDAEHLRGSDP